MRQREASRRSAEFADAGTSTDVRLAIRVNGSSIFACGRARMRFVSTNRAGWSGRRTLSAPSARRTKAASSTSASTFPRVRACAPRAGARSARAKARLARALLFFSLTSSPLLLAPPRLPVQGAKRLLQEQDLPPEHRLDRRHLPRPPQGQLVARAHAEPRPPLHLLAPRLAQPGCVGLRAAKYRTDLNLHLRGLQLPLLFLSFPRTRLLQTTRSSPTSRTSSSTTTNRTPRAHAPSRLRSAKSSRR